MCPAARPLLLALLLIAALLAGSAPQALAGAWPRGKGHGFLSLAYDWTSTVEGAAAISGAAPDPGVEPDSFGYTAVFAEYGVTDRLGFGLDAGQEDAPDTFQAIVFATYAVTPPDWRHHLSLELGVGQREYPADAFDAGNLADLEEAGTERVLRPGISWGYGAETPWGAGWATVDARLEMRQHHGDRIPKIDTTIGLSLPKGNLAYLQMQYSDYPGADPRLRLVPSYVLRLKPWLALETAALWDVWGGDRVGLRAGIWFEF